jgi:hypothetical protein
MKEPRKTQPQRWKLQASAALVFTVLALCLLSSTVWARYQISKEAELTLVPESQGQTIYFLPLESQDQETEDNQETEESQNISWKKSETEENAYTMTFRLANGQDEEKYCEQDQTAALRLIAQGAVDQNMKITLTYGNEEPIEATGTEITEGTVLYDSYGSGMTYRFYKDDQEVTWTLTGGAFSTQEITITVTGVGEQIAALSLIAEQR